MIMSSARRIYFETQLAPTPGRCDIAVMDNFGSRKTEAASAAVRGAGARPLSLPPCATPTRSSRRPPSSSISCGRTVREPETIFGGTSATS